MIHPNLTGSRRRVLSYTWLAHRNIIDRGTFKLAFLPDTDVLLEKILPSKFVQAIKHEDGRDIYKARLCLGGHREFLKFRVMHIATTLSQLATRIILALASISSFNLWTTDYMSSLLAIRRETVKGDLL
jgi:hypothetical protein